MWCVEIRTLSTECMDGVRVDGMSTEELIGPPSFSVRLQPVRRCLRGGLDGGRGSVDWRKGNWQGYQGEDFEAIVDLGTEKTISKLGAGFLQDVSPWILFPKKVDFLISTDGEKFSKVLTILNTVPDTSMKAQTKDFIDNISPRKSRYVKVIAKTYGTLPPWHPGAGYDSHIFVDEILVSEE